MGQADQWRVVRHFDVPPGNNSAGVPWSDALVNSGQGGTTVLPDGDGTGGTISIAEKAFIEAGVIHEDVGDFRLLSDGGSSAKITGSAQKLYKARNTEVQSELKAHLDLFGANIDKA